MECNCIDYPVSWTFWREHCWTVHGIDVGPNEYEGEPTREVRIIPQERVLQELRAELNYYIQQLDNLRSSKEKKKSKYD